MKKYISTSKETKMLKQLYRAIKISRLATAATNSMQYLSDSLLHYIGFSRDTFVEEGVLKLEFLQN